MLCVFPACVSGSLVSLLKLSQHGKCWLAGKCWELAGAGGICFWENNGSTAAWNRPIFSRKNNGRTAIAILDSLYKKCYNKCNDNNKNVICHQTGKNAPTSRFSSLGYKITPNAKKRRTAHLHKIWEYKNPGTVRRTRTAGNGIPIYTKRAFC